MAMTASLHVPSPFPFPLLPSKTSHFLSSPLPEPNPYSRGFYRCSFPTVSNRQVPHLSISGKWVLNSLTVRSEGSLGNRQPMVPPYNVLITGSTKGIGYSLAKEFLKAGDNVVICSRSADGVESAVQSLREEFGEQHVWGTKCDVREGQDVKDLVSFAQRNLGYIDIWINNAGSNAYSYKPLAEASDEDLIEVVTTNSLGLMICCREAIKMMLNQTRGGHIFNIDGAGSDGRPTPRFAAYGATKRSVVHLTKSLQAELQMQDVKSVVVHNLSPGMVTTDLLMSGATTKQAKFFINVLAEPAEVVAEYLVPNIRSIIANGSMKPTYIRFLTGLKAYTQIFSSFFIFNDTSYPYVCDYNLKASRILSWKNGTDCCTWSGVMCDKVTGNVIQLNLHCGHLQGVIHSSSTLFFLPHLHSLDLSFNNFSGSQISANFGRFTSMRHLNLSHSYFNGQVPREISYLSQLLSLDLSRNYNLKLKTWSLQRITANLTNLKELRLSFVNMSFVETHSLMNLSSSLTSLHLSFSNIRGKFPEKIFLLPNLQVLHLTYNENLTGFFPKSNWSTSPIRELALSGTAFSIDMSYLVRKMKFLNGLYLSNCTFIRSYPPLVMVGNLSKITHLDLSFNYFGGHIPWNIFQNLQQLISLDLSGNNFVGQLPKTCINNSNQIPFLCDSSQHQLLDHVPMNLENLDLSSNNLNGTIPSWLYSLPVLKDLGLASNQFIGTIQEFRYASLSYLNLRGNKLHGPIPISVFQQQNLISLDLSQNNLSGAVGLDQFSKLKNLWYLSLSYNKLSLSFNDFENYTLPNLEILELSSCNISEFPYFLRASEYLVSLDLSQNKIQGHLPIPQPSTSIYFISNNQLFGEIPSSICALTSIEVLDLSHNTLNGSIPLCLGNLSYLSVLDLRMNMFDGTIPTTFSKGNTLRNIDLNGNRLKGPLPRALGNCRKLEILDLGNNMINDTFPPWLESLPKLRVLILRSNKFHGSLGSPKVRFPFRELRIMDLSNNNFSGLLPTKYFENFLAMMLDEHVDQLTYMGEYLYEDSVSVTMKGFEMELEHILNIFTAIDFSRNNFDGEIPKSLGNLKSLKGLNLSHNKISGHIPTSLGNLTNLEWLDLSSNYLSGEIPMQLTEIKWLAVLNLSHNHLVGAIPHGKQFYSFEIDSYIGNLGLCGFPLTKTCGNGEAQPPSASVSDHQEDTNGFDWKYVFMGYASGLVIGISVGYMFLTDKRLACLIRKVGGERWVKSITRRKRPNGGFRNRRRTSAA
ncbi:hypothetical protein FNV43_RR25453 [Rhamnella rubrinervis]|uniref:chlorophyll(ide) b reductase n=1 Tax=Rhamnella rubrinervis TaxID=2594499 RepID=A0A8K0GU62_9ROSA|nr:hypothetical protein FNV43_RR25453 [Rhamnella rubrinervis]